MKAVKAINIYLAEKRRIVPINLVQYDTGNQLVFTVKDFSIPSEATATLYVQKPSGKFVYQKNNISIADNVITIDLENQALTEYGKIPYQVAIISGSDTVTTFTGLLLVEKSLKSSGAAESKTVINAFDELTAEKVSEFQSRVETITSAAIATIPEDYTAMSEKVNEFANAFKGSLSGAVVAADDVSPVEHLPAVRIHGKNLIYFPYSETTLERYGVTFTVNDDGGISVSGTPTKNTSFNLSGTTNKNIPIKKGKTYVLSCNSSLNASSGYVFLQNKADGMTYNSVSTVNSSVKFTATADGYASIGLVVLTGNTFDQTVYIQLEEGTTATEYTPFVDPSAVTVKRCGKNLACASYSYEVTQYGLTISGTKGSSRVSITGTAEKANSYSIMKGIILQPGTYTASLIGANVVDASNDRIYVANQETGAVIKNNITTGNPKSFSVSEKTTVKIEMVFASGSEYSERVIKVQIEPGESSTDYNEFNGTEYVPSTNGTVDGLTSLSPNMTILTDTDGITVECEYNKDTNKVVSKLIEAITEIGGEVII